MSAGAFGLEIFLIPSKMTGKKDHRRSTHPLFAGKPGKLSANIFEVRVVLAASGVKGNALFLDDFNEFCLIRFHKPFGRLLI